MSGAKAYRTHGCISYWPRLYLQLLRINVRLSEEPRYFNRECTC